MSNYDHRISSMLRRERPGVMFPWLSYDEKFNLLYCEGGFMGRSYEASLLSGIDQTSITQFIGALNQELPAGTFIQFHRISHPDIHDVMSDYANIRLETEVDSELTKEQRSLLISSSNAEIEYLNERVEKKTLYPDTGIHLHSSRLFVTFKIPVPLIPSDEILKETSDRIDAITAPMIGAGLRMRMLGLDETKAFIKRCFFINQPYDNSIDRETLIKEQIFSPGDMIDQEDGLINISHDNQNTSVAAISVKHFPEQMALQLMSLMAGDPNGIREQIKRPHIFAYSIHFPDHVDKRRSITNKSTTLNYQAYGPLLRWVPKLAYRKKGMDVLVHAGAEGNRFIEVDFRVLIYCPNKEDAYRSAQSYVSLAEGMQFQMARESQIHYPMFLNSMPMFPSTESIGLCHRYKTMAANQAAQFLPILEDWQGTNTPVLMLTTRRGLPMPLDLYDSNTNHNFLISGDTGSGKSFFSQALIWSYLSIGAACFVIEIGNSFKKTCAIFGGSHLRFDLDSNICINPFSTVTELDEEIEILTTIIETMMAPREGLDDFRLSIVREAIRAVFSKYGTRMTPTNIQEYLFSQTDENGRAREMGQMMGEFCDGGAYSQWFNGPANIDLGARLVVLELEDLLAKESLRRVIELALIQRVSREMYSRRKGQKKILFLDEASETLNGPGMEKFVTGAYERIRKHNGAIGIGIQDIMKLNQKGSGAGRAVVGLSNFKFLLKQPSGTVELMKTEKIMTDIGQWGYDQINGLRTIPNLYSEIFVSANSSRGVGRLTLERFKQILFSTRGAERDMVFQWMSEGMSAADAINLFIEKEKLSSQNN